MGELLLLLVLCAKPVLGQHAPEGIWEGYDGEWKPRDKPVDRAGRGNAGR
jgi:hypothetical protein